MKKILKTDWWLHVRFRHKHFNEVFNAIHATIRGLNEKHPHTVGIVLYQDKDVTRFVLSREAKRMMKAVDELDRIESKPKKKRKVK